MKKISGRKTYEVKDVIVFEDGEYKVKNHISENGLRKIRNLLYEKSDEAVAEFDEFYNRYFVEALKVVEESE